MKKNTWRYYHLSHVYHKQQSYDVWFLRYGASDRQNFLTFWTMVCPFTPLTTQKAKNFEKLRNAPGDTIILQKCSKNHNQMLYCSLDMAHNRFNYFSFWTIFCPFTSLTAWKIKIKKKKRQNAWRYYHFTYLYQKLWSDDVRFLRHGARQTDGRTDGKSDILRWVPHLKNKLYWSSIQGIKNFAISQSSVSIKMSFYISHWNKPKIGTLLLT